MGEKKELAVLDGGKKEITRIVDQKTIDEFLFTYDGAQKFSEGQKKLFAKMAIMNQLNPFKKEIYPIPRWNASKQGYDLTIVTGYEVYLKRAERSGQYGGADTYCEGTLTPKTITKWNKEVKVWRGDLRATAVIRRKDWHKEGLPPMKITVYFTEYTQDNQMWFDKPRTMLEKVALEQGLRRAFPLDFDGMPYASDEMPTETIAEPQQAQDIAAYAEENRKQAQSVAQPKKVAELPPELKPSDVEMMTPAQRELIEKMLKTHLISDADKKKTLDAINKYAVTKSRAAEMIEHIKDTIDAARKAEKAAKELPPDEVVPGDEELSDKVYEPETSDTFGADLIEPDALEGARLEAVAYLEGSGLPAGAQRSIKASIKSATTLDAISNIIKRIDNEIKGE